MGTVPKSSVRARLRQTLSGFQMNNPLPEFLEDENGFTPIDLFWEEDVSEDPNWMQKVTYRVGQIVVELNSLEQKIDSCILDWMNERGEDARIWAFIEQMPVSKKINALFTIYSRTCEWTDVPKSLVSDARDLKRRITAINVRRNFYVHANWYSTINEMVEHKTRQIPNSVYGRVRRKTNLAEFDRDINEIKKLANELSEFHYSAQQAMIQ